MNYIREAKEILKHYRDLKIATDNLRDRLAEITLELEGYKAIEYTGMPHSTVGNIDKNLDLIFQRDKTSELLKKNISELCKLDSAIDNLDREFKFVLFQSYVEQKTDTDISKELKCTREKINRLKGEGIRKLAIQLFGIEAV